MKFNVTKEEMQKVKLFIATPMYGGQCYGHYSMALVNLTLQLQQMGIKNKVHFLTNESLITRARNYCTELFLTEPGEYTHMIFIDADVSFDSRGVMDMIALFAADREDKYKILCGPYPKKTIAWEKIKKAVDLGAADKDPKQLENYVGDYVFNRVHNEKQFNLLEPTEVMEAGTGFMMIKREVFELMDKEFPELLYKPDHARTKDFDGSKEIMAYFDCVIDPVSKRYLSEDYMFCQNARKINIPVHLCPWIQLKHTGTYTFGGSLQHLSSIAVSTTS